MLGCNDYLAAARFSSRQPECNSTRALTDWQTRICNAKCARLHLLLQLAETYLNLAYRNNGTKFHQVNLEVITRLSQNSSFFWELLAWTMRLLSSGACFKAIGFPAVALAMMG